MRPTHSKQCALPFGTIADILFQIIINGEPNTILTLCLLDRATYNTIKVLEPHICRWFMRLHGIDTFDPILTINPWTGQQNALTVHTLVRSLYRHDLARRLSLHIVPSVWGPFYDDNKVEMNFEAELKLAKRLERGLHVLFHMADISRDTKRKSPSSSVSKRLTILTKLLDEYTDANSNRDLPFNTHNPLPTTCPTPTKKDLAKILKLAHPEHETGLRRLLFRTHHLDENSEIAFHCTLRMLRELLERMLLHHGPKIWHRDTRNEYSVVSWFLLNQGPRSLAKLFLSPQDQCCQLATSDTGMDSIKCRFSNPLDEYWAAWEDSPDLGGAGAGIGAGMGMGMGINKGISMDMDLGMIIGKSIAAKQRTGPVPNTTASPGCDCKRRVRSWSVKPALFDNRGREYNRAAERYLKEKWSQRHVGLHEAFTMGIFATVL
ncbi:hypothetical protein BDW62DRAFT_181427 [Aspergillus aurantiobrunneus]